MKIYSIFKKLSVTLFLIFPLLTSCQALKPKKVDAKNIPNDPKERVKRNIEEGRGFRLMGGNTKGGVFEFASSNYLWRATLDTIDFMPLASANYSGGIVITDWYTENNVSNESIKISVRFLSNEVRSDALDIKIFTKNCDTSIDCKINENKGSLVTELTKSILKKATIYEKQGVNKRKSYENAALD